ncbi:MAG: lysylphosphatidylglycerol synthase domain-containing protein [archaeon]
MNKISTLFIIFLLFLGIYAVFNPKIYILPLILGSLSFTLSIVFWSLSWDSILRTGRKKAILLNFLSFQGVSVPGIGTDVARIIWAKKMKLSRSEVLSTSLIVKVFRSFFSIILLAIALILLSKYSFDAYSFYPVILSTMFAILVFIIFIVFFQRMKFRNYYSKKIAECMRRHLEKLSITQSMKIMFFLIISIFFEFLCVYFAVLSSGRDLTTIHYLLLGSFSSSINAVSITPQGVGVNDALIAWVLSSGYFKFDPQTIASFIISYGIMRFWVPLILSFLANMFVKSDV